MRLRCAVLDDFQDIATTIADWSPLHDRVDGNRPRRTLFALQCVSDLDDEHRAPLPFRPARPAPRRPDRRTAPHVLSRPFVART
ncbi:hypothetical protein ACH4CD_31450 [Streptomyces fungicidicus]|uniref:hypothetical protein n=1 Tax=Streptomyces fungicidicus TaxID=68203 RepID=UPI0037996E61